MIAARQPERSWVLESELAREVGPGQVLQGRRWSVVAEAMPQDEVLVQDGDDVFLVHLTWKGRAEAPPWPVAEHVDSADEFEQLLDLGY